MGFTGLNIILHFLTTLMFLQEMKNLDTVLSNSAVVVALDGTLISNALASFDTKGGDKDSFDLILCMDHTQLSGEWGGRLENHVLGYRVRITKCSEVAPPSASDYNQILYMMFPDNKTAIANILQEIALGYHTTKKTFYSSQNQKLLWMPLFLVVWPDFEDYCQDWATSEELIRAFLANENVYETFIVNSDVYIYLGSNCNELQDNVWEVYSLNKKEFITQKLTPDRRKYESMFEGILGRVRRRMNLYHTTIRAVASRDPSSFLEGPGPNVFDPLEVVNGTPRVVFRELQQALNFTVENLVGDWISRHSNGTLKGSTVNLFRQELADLLISQTSLLPYRKVELSFLQPTYSNSINGFFVQPAASSFRDIVIAPFTFDLWLCLLVTYFILIVSILFFGRQYRKLYNRIYEQVPQSDLAIKDEVLLWAVGAVTQQGWYICPKSNSTRMAFSLGYLLGLVCYGAFSAAVVSILAVEMIPIKSRSDLLNSSLNFYADNASSTMAYIVDYLRTHTNIKFGNRVGIKEGVARLRSKEPSCYIAFPHYFYLSAASINISESWICSHLSVIPVTTSGTPSSMVVPRDSAYAELLNFMILKMLSRGLNFRYTRLYNEATTSKCSKQDNNQFFHPLAVQDVFTACLILFAGLVLGLSLLCLEKLRRYLSKLSKEKIRTRLSDTVDLTNRHFWADYG